MHESTAAAVAININFELSKAKTPTAMTAGITAKIITYLMIFFIVFYRQFLQAKYIRNEYMPGNLYIYVRLFFINFAKLGHLFRRNGVFIMAAAYS